MDLEREQLIEIAVSVLWVGLFIAAMVYIGVTYTESGELTGEGPVMLIALMIGFVVVMTGTGYWLSGREA